MNHFPNRKFSKIFLTYFGVLGVLAFIFIYYTYNIQKKQLLSRISEYYSQYLFNRAELVRSVINPVISNLFFLANHRSVINYMNDMKNVGRKDALIEDMILFARNNVRYKQVRFIDAGGMEQIRINWDDHNLIIVPDSLLQNKSERLYFKETMKITPGSVYVSPIDLNVEFGKVEVPYQPVIRIATSIADENGKITGIIVINIYLKDFLFNSFSKDIYNRENFHFLNSDGYWLQGPHEFSDFGFMFDSLQTAKFDKFYPELWQQIKTTEFGKIENDKKLCLFRHVQLTNSGAPVRQYNGVLINSPVRKWILAYLIDYKDIEELFSLKLTVFWMSGLVLLILVIISYTIAKLRMKELRYVSDLFSLNNSLEQRIEIRTLELSQRNRDLKAANQELEAFTYSVSHDLRAPLRHISGFVDLLIKRHRDELTEGGQTYLDYIKEASGNMSNLIDDMLKLSRVGRSDLTVSQFNMADIVKECATAVEKDYSQLKIKWEINDDLKVVAGDYKLLSQVWLNLLNNAAKYSSKKDLSIIKISCKEVDGFLVYSVTDNGVGFDEAYSSKLFGTFQRLHSSEDYEGNGIGLAIVRRIIVRHGGKVWARSKLNKGATFCFSLPINN